MTAQANEIADNAIDLHAVMPMYNLIEHSDLYSKIFCSLWKRYIDDLDDSITNSEFFKSEVKIIRNCLIQNCW